MDSNDERRASTKGAFNGDRSRGHCGRFVLLHNRIDFGRKFAGRNAVQISQRRQNEIVRLQLIRTVGSEDGKIPMDVVGPKKTLSKSREKRLERRTMHANA